MGHKTGQDRPRVDLYYSIADAFAEFLTVPSCIIVGFLALAAGSYLLDRANPAWLVPLRNLLQSHVFGDPAATTGLLAIIAAGLITVTSITISLLLLALQQSAANMTTQILDQFMRRRINQIYFGFFVGLALYALITLATVNQPFNPIFGATFACLLTIVALYLLIILLYTTINQMRPAQIMEAIHDHVLAARQRQLGLMRKTRRAPRCQEPATSFVKANHEGFVTRVDIHALSRAARNVPGAEVTVATAIGDYVAFQDVIVSITAPQDSNLNGFSELAQRAVILERQRDITRDAAYGVQQLALIGWTSISSAKSQVGPGLLALHALRDILAHWSVDESEMNKEDQNITVLPIVYVDNAFEQLLDAFESLAVISSESMQYQAFAEVLRTFAGMYPRLPMEHHARVEDLLQRILPALGDHVLTHDLDCALSEIVQTLIAVNRLKTAALVREAQRKLQQSVGKLKSRSTRAPD